VKGNPFTLSFLEEVLEYDGRCIAGHERMISSQIKLLILLEAESQDDNPTPIKNLFQNPQPSYYSSLYYSFVEYWKNAVRADNKTAQDIVLKSFDYLILSNCYVREKVLQDPDVFVSDIYLIERELREADPIPVIHGTQSDENDIHIEDRTGWSLGYISKEELSILFSELLILRPWLTPWIIRVASKDVREKVIDYTERIPNRFFQFSILRHELVENPTDNISAWIEVLSKIIRKHSSDEMITLLSDTLTESDFKLSNEILEAILGVSMSSKFDDERKYSLIISSASHSLSRRQKERVRQVLLDAPKLMQKYYCALAAIHDIENIPLESFFTELEQSTDYKWMALLLKRILKDEQSELVREKFLLLPLSCINIIERQLLKPQEYIRFEKQGFQTYEKKLLDEESTIDLQQLCEDWWKHYLGSIDDAITLLEDILEPWDETFDDSGFMHISFDFHEIFERLITWVASQDREMQFQFIMACLESKLDLSLPTYRKIIQPIFKEFINNDKINLKLFELFKDRPFYLLSIWGKKAWLKYIDKFPRDLIAQDEGLFQYLVESGGLSTIV
jgi:hypothetical protein